MTNPLFTEDEQKAIVEAIKQAELSTSGEIRVHIEKRSKIEVLDRAAFVFKQLAMHKTALRNGVLFYLAYADKKFAIIGDAGINKVVPENFWDEIKNAMLIHFKAENFTLGLTSGIEMAGIALKNYFPYNAETDINELPDEISFGKQ